MSYFDQVNHRLTLKIGPRYEYLYEVHCKINAFERKGDAWKEDDGWKSQSTEQGDWRNQDATLEEELYALHYRVKPRFFLIRHKTSDGR